MQNLYQRLKDGEGRAEALAATQQGFRQHPMGVGVIHTYGLHSNSVVIGNHCSGNQALLCYLAGSS